jgi:hypothetical protein
MRLAFRTHSLLSEEREFAVFSRQVKVMLSFLSATALQGNGEFHQTNPKQP